MSVKLIIKSAAQCVEDFTLNCEITWTISQVKEEISRYYPTRPTKEQQKLIYGGKLLPNELLLSTILNQTQDFHVLHLVCPLPPIKTEKITGENKEKSTPVYTSTPAFSAAGMYSQINPQFYTSVGAPGNVPFNPTPDAQQYFVFQQMYTQMVTQYFAQLTGNGAYIQSPASVSPAPQVPADVQNAAPNAAPGRAEEEEDLLDYVYIFLRVFMLTSLLLYYSSFTRVIGVTCMIVFFTWLAKLTKQRRRRAEALRVLNNAQENVQQETQTTEGQLNEQTAETTPDETTATTSPSMISTVFTLISAFFSSLIPNDPLPVNGN